MRVTYICIYMYVTVCMCICMRVCEFLPFFFSLLFLFFETVSQSTAQAGLGLLISLLMLPSAGIIGACHCPCLALQECVLAVLPSASVRDRSSLRLATQLAAFFGGQAGQLCLVDFWTTGRKVSSWLGKWQPYFQNLRLGPGV